MEDDNHQWYRCSYSFRTFLDAKFILTGTELKAKKEQGRMKYLFQALMMVRLYLHQKPCLIEVIIFILRKNSLEFFLSNFQKFLSVKC